MQHTTILCFLVFCSFVALTFSSSCLFTLFDTNRNMFFYNLTSLQTYNPYYIDATGDYMYVWSFCAGVNHSCIENGVNKGNSFKCIQQHKFQDLCFYFGANATINDVQSGFIDTQAPSKGIVMKYTHGEPTADGKARESVMQVFCDTTFKSRPEIFFEKEGGDDERITEYFRAYSIAGCPRKN